MNCKLLRLLAATAAVIACLLVSQEVSAQSVQYYYPANNYVPYQVVQPSAQYYSYPRTTSYRPTARPLTGYGANLHRNFTIKQELQRSQRTGRPVRYRGNVRWVR